METQGKTVLSESGKRALRKTGKGALFDENGNCPDCCCQITVLASFVTNFEVQAWDLTPYQGEDMASPGAFWRLIEVGNCYPSTYPWYGAG